MQKIMFNDRYGLTAAVLEGRKTMTRRVISGNADVYFSHWSLNNSHHWQLVVSKNCRQASLSRFVRNEVVAIAQAYKDLDYSFHGFATNPSRSCGIKKECAEKQKGWDNKMFVEAKFMRHHIKITDIKVERLQDISDEDCLREGVEHIERGYIFKGMPESIDDYPTAREAFAALIDKVSGEGTWASNPWVYVFRFERVD